MDEGKSAQLPPRNYDIEIPLRGCRLSLPEIAEAYEELQELCSREGERVLSKLIKPSEKSDLEWADELSYYRLRAFRLTVSIIGGEDNVTRYGEDASIFAQRGSLPKPIDTVFFTNENAFRANANGNLPPNRFALWLHFHRETLANSSFLLSEATSNPSKVTIRADDLPFLRAAQTIILNKLKRRRLWYRILHERFSYDAGLWLVGFPYALYISASLTSRIFGVGSAITFQSVSLYIYSTCLSVLCYRLFFSYAKWALPVNILDENEDRSAKHRAVFGIIMTGIITSVLYDLIKSYIVVWFQ